MDGPGQAGDGKPDFVARERAQRLAKQERLQAKEGPAYGYDRDHTLAQARAEFDGLRERYLDLIVNPYFQIKSLRDFDAKFGPRWAPRSIMVEDVGSMPRVGLLYASVEGFLNLPLVGRRLEPRQEPAAPPVAQPAGAVTAA